MSITLYRLTLEGEIIFHFVKHLIHICRPGSGKMAELEVKLRKGQEKRSEDEIKQTRSLSQFSVKSQ